MLLPAERSEGGRGRQCVSRERGGMALWGRKSGWLSKRDFVSIPRTWGEWPARGNCKGSSGGFVAGLRIPARALRGCSFASPQFHQQMPCHPGEALGLLRHLPNGPQPLGTRSSAGEPGMRSAPGPSGGRELGIGISAHPRGARKAMSSAPSIEATPTSQGLPGTSPQC